MKHMIARRWLAACAACAWIACLAPTAQAIEVAGELFVNLDAVTFTTGSTTWDNTGTYTDFEAVGAPTRGLIETTPAVFFDGASAFYGLDSAPEGLTGLNPTRSIEVWTLNPNIAQEETLVSWGHRGGPAGTNMSFNYGFHGMWGAVGHWEGVQQDLGWIDNAWTAGAPAPNKWHHLVYTYDGEATRVYSDGELWNEENLVDLGWPLDTYPVPAIAIASQWDNDVDLTAGIRGSLAIGRVRIHDGVLTPAQILSNYNEEKAGFVNPGGGGPTAEVLTAGPVHRYSFSGDANDSVGTAHGVLVNTTGDAKYEAGALVLGNTGAENSNAGNGDYVDLPNGLISGLGKNATFETWTNWGGPVPGWWQRVFDFGTSDGGEDVSPGGANSTYLFLTPYGGDTSIRFGYRWGPNADEHWIQDVTSPPVGEETHLAVVWNADAGTSQLFVDGQLVASGTLHFDLDEMDDDNNWLGRSQWADAMYVGSYNEFRIYNYALTANQVYGNFLAGADTVNTGGGLKGDYNKNGSLDAGDLDLQASEINKPSPSLDFDLTGDGKVDYDDRVFWVEDKSVKNSWIGDADLNGEFTSADFVQVFVAGKYETGEAATWEEGDWNADLLFTSGDFVAAFTSGGYELGAKPAVSAVPEPAGMALLLVGALALLGLRRRS